MFILSRSFATLSAILCSVFWLCLMKLSSDSHFLLLQSRPGRLQQAAYSRPRQGRICVHREVSSNFILYLVSNCLHLTRNPDLKNSIDFPHIIWYNKLNEMTNPPQGLKPSCESMFLISSSTSIVIFSIGISWLISGYRKYFHRHNSFCVNEVLSILLDKRAALDSIVRRDTTG